MKTLMILIAFVALSMNAFAQTEKTASFWVRGNCEMCQERIETTLKKTDGVKEAKWDIPSKMLKVKFDGAKTSQDALEKLMAKVGHRTKKYKADQKAHDNLPSCCKEKS